MPKPKSLRIPKPIWFGVLAVLMVVLAVFLSVWLPYHREQVAIREIEKLGGEVRTQLLYPRFFGLLSYVELGGSTFNDEGLKHLSGFTNLKHLSLANTEISDDGLKHISGLTNIKLLYLENTRVSDEGLKHLTGLRNLESLFLENT